MSDLMHLFGPLAPAHYAKQPVESHPNFNGRKNEQLHQQRPNGDTRLFSAVFLAAKKAAAKVRAAQAAGRRVNHGQLVQDLLIQEYHAVPGGGMKANDTAAAVSLAKVFVSAARSEGMELSYEAALKIAKGQHGKLTTAPKDQDRLVQFARKRYAKVSAAARKADAPKTAIRETNRLRLNGQADEGTYRRVLKTLLTA